MGIRNSTFTRVQPLFDYILKDCDKLNKLLKLVNSNISVNGPINIILYGDTETAITPPPSLLIWCINNLDELERPKNYGVKMTSPTYKKRESLFNKDKSATNDALMLLKNENIPQRDWYIFEGYTHPDFYIETDDTIIIGEAKRTEDKLTTTTTWLKNRDQLIRHIDSVIDRQKRTLSFLIVDDPKMYNLDCYEKEVYFEESLKHRDNQTIKKIKESYIGCITWNKIANSFKLNFPDTISI